MGQEEETIVVFTADHGEMLGDHGLVFKGTTYEQVTRMPLLVSPTGALRDAPRVVDELASAVDVPATILDLAGLARPAGMQGASLRALGAGEADGAGAAGGPAGGGSRAHRDALLIENQGVRRSVRTKDYLFTWHGPGLRGELYDLHADPGCFRNLWDDPSSRELKANAHDALLDLMARNLDPSHQQTGAC
ncbi:MAG: sulfatase, partial [Spirochaetota bacterium]